MDVRPLREDGTLDLTEAARLSLERMADEIMDAQADELCGEGNRRNGYRERGLMTMVGEITPGIPKLREGTYFPDELVRPYSRVDRSVVAAVREVYARGLSTRKIERAADALEFGSPGPSRVSAMTADLDDEVAALRAERFEGAFPYLRLDATCIKCRDEGHVQGRAVVTAIACAEDGSRRFVGFDCVDVESTSSWKAFLRGLRARGVSGVRCVTSDAHGGLVAAVSEVFPGAAWQRCIVHLERDLAGWLPRRQDRAAGLAALSAAFAERDPGLVRAMYRQAAEQVSAISGRAGRLLEDAEADALAYLDFPYTHHLKLRTNNVQERANEEIRRRVKVISAFPSEVSMMRLVGAVLLDVNDVWSDMKFLDAEGLGDVRRRRGDIEPPSPELVEKAKAYVLAAMEEKRRAA